MKYITIILVIWLISIKSYGQNDYYSTDSTVLIGIRLIDGGDIDNSRFCQVVKGETITKYSPDEVKEFGFKNGRIYKSFSIRMNDTILQYFLEKLVEGKVNLYYLKASGGIKKYYVTDDDNNLTELPQLKEKYDVLLDSLIIGCPQAIHNIHSIKYKKASLIRFIQDYNNCTERPFPEFQYGFTTGLSLFQFSAIDLNSIYSIPNYKKDWSYSIGAFIDIPIQFSNFSIHPEILFRQTGISTTFDNEGISNDMVINYSSICLPLLFRYYILRNKISPYFLAGTVYSRAIKNNGTVYEYNFSGDDILINIIDAPILHENLGGFSIGSGFISKYGSKYSWFGELRFCKYYNLGQGSKFLNLSEINMGIGFIF